jgi:predicted metal-binding membrane protein
VQDFDVSDHKVMSRLGGGMLAEKIRVMGGAHWLILFGAIATAWGLLYAISLPADLRTAGQFYGLDFVAQLCVVTPDAAGFMRLVLMWVLMSAAMMAPTILPALATYDDLSQTTPDTNFAHLVAGYFLVWVGFSVFAALAQMVLFNANLVSLFGDSRSTLLSSSLLMLAGLYQFSPLKEACLSKCRQPMMFFLQYWNEGPWRNGIRLGLICLGCCWALMFLAFVGGVMNLVFMGIATVIMMLEKLPQLGWYLTKPLGGILVVCSVCMLLSSW